MLVLNTLLENLIVLGYYPYEGTFPQIVLNRFEKPKSKGKHSHSFHNCHNYDILDKWWTTTVRVVDFVKKGSYPPVYGRAEDNKVTLKVMASDVYADPKRVTGGNTPFYITYYDGDYIIHLGVMERNKEAFKLIEVVFNTYPSR